MRDNIISFQRSADEWMHRARTAMAKGEGMKGIRCYRKAMDMVGNHPFILLELGFAYFSLHCYETVDHLVCTYMQSVQCFGASELDGEWCNLVAISATNRQDEALAHLALKAYFAIDPDGALQRGADKMLASFPWKQSIPPPRASRAYTLLRRAGEDVDKVLTAELRDPTGRCAVRAANLLALSDPHRALHYAQIAQQKGVPEWDEFEYHLACAKAYAAIGHLPESEVAWGRAYALCDRLDRVETMVRAALQMGQYEWAEMTLHDWMQYEPNAVSLLRLQVMTYAAQGKTEAETAARARLRQRDPWHPLCTQTVEQTEQTLAQKRSMIWDRIAPLAAAYPEEGDTKTP